MLFFFVVFYLFQTLIHIKTTFKKWPTLQHICTIDYKSILTLRLQSRLDYNYIGIYIYFQHKSTKLNSLCLKFCCISYSFVIIAIRAFCHINLCKRTLNRFEFYGLSWEDRSVVFLMGTSFVWSFLTRHLNHTIIIMCTMHI